VKPPFARALTHLYGRSWQRKYGAEFESLLIDLPMTPALLADVLPRALASRPEFIAAIGAILLTLALAGFHMAEPSRTSQVAVRVTRHAALPPCRSYSSTADGGIATRLQCLD
jgi:hypothetical protein